MGGGHSSVSQLFLNFILKLSRIAYWKSIRVSYPVNDSGAPQPEGKPCESASSYCFSGRLTGGQYGGNHPPICEVGIPGLTIAHLYSESIAQYILFALVLRMQRVPHIICGSVTSLTRAKTREALRLHPLPYIHC